MEQLEELGFWSQADLGSNLAIWWPWELLNPSGSNSLIGKIEIIIMQAFSNHQHCCLLST